MASHEVVYQPGTPSNNGPTIDLSGIDWKSQANWFLDPLDLGGKRAASTAFQNQQYLDQQARDFNASEAAIQRQWEEHMSSTAIQRQVADAKAAGINPAALFGSGASGAGADTPSGSSAASSSGNANIANNKLSAAVGAFALFVRLLLTKGK